MLVVMQHTNVEEWFHVAATNISASIGEISSVLIGRNITKY
jgi:hypothetical protein